MKKITFLYFLFALMVMPAMAIHSYPAEHIKRCSGDTATLRVPSELVVAGNYYQWFELGVSTPKGIEDSLVYNVTASKSFCLYIFNSSDDTLAMKYFFVSPMQVYHETLNVVECGRYFWDEVSWTYYSSIDTTVSYKSVDNCDSTISLHLVIKKKSNVIDNVVVCDSLIWIDGNTYKASTTSPTYKLTNVAGCDSTVNLNLTIKHSTSSLDSKVACDSFTWIDGNTYTASNNYSQFIMPNSQGCDSVISLSLTVNYRNSGDTIAVVCDNFDWYEYHMTATGVATHTFPLGNAKGCDSTLTLHLTVNHSSNGVDVRLACDSLSWINGNTYTASTTSPTYILTNVAGCDSTLTLNLTVYPSTSFDDQQQACDSYVWSRNGRFYSESNNTDWVYGGKDVHQCDSIIHLVLTLNNSNRTDSYNTVCDGMSWYGQMLGTSGEYVHTQSGAGVCTDSVVLHLTVNQSTTGVEFVTACDSIIWHGTKYYSSTDTPQYTMLGGNSKGCDSTTTLHLNLQRGQHQSFNAVACDSYIWDRTGDTYTNSGVYTYSYISQDGCNSKDTLHLTVNTSTSSIDAHSACDNYLWIDGNTYTTSNNTAQYTINNAKGCDSTITLNLTVHYSDYSSQTENVCDEYVWSANGILYNQSGQYVYQTTDAYGCDVVKTLNLTIRESSHEVIHEAVCESYVWDKGSGSRLFTSSTVEELTYVNEVGCPSSDSLYLTVYGLEVPKVRNLVEKKHKGAANPWMLIYPRNSGEEEYYYQWYRNGEPITGANKQYFQLPTENVGDSIVYSVWVASGNVAMCSSYSYDTIYFTKQSKVVMTTYPNPAVEQFDLSIQSDDFDAVLLDVYSESGQCVMSIPMHGNTVSVDTKLPSGVYFLKVTSSNGKSANGKIVISE